MKNRSMQPRTNIRKIRLSREVGAQGYKHINIGVGGVFNNSRRC